MFIGLHVKCPSLLSDFNGNLNILNSFSKNTQIPNFMNIWLVGGEVFHVDSRTDGETWRSWLSLFVVLRTHLKMCFS